jgi:hypothetical protein
MAGLSDYAENVVLDAYFGSGTPATLYLALYTAAPSDSGGGTEVSGGSYARKAVTNNSTNFPAASSGSKALAVAQTFVTPTGSWGTVTHAALHDASTSGNLITWWALSASQVVASGNTVTVPATTGLVITLD